MDQQLLERLMGIGFVFTGLAVLMFALLLMGWKILPPIATIAIVVIAAVVGIVTGAAMLMDSREE